VLSAARPKIADYPFTTLVPNLGVVRRPSGDGTVFADIPGLSEGAAAGAGLGHDFLRHIERTKMLVHLLDASAEDVVADLAVVDKELALYGHDLPTKPRLVAFNKADLLDEASLNALVEALAVWGEGKGWIRPRPLVVSAATSRGMDPLLDAIWRHLDGIQSS
jgi:GTP-binding protein